MMDRTTAAVRPAPAHDRDTSDGRRRVVIEHLQPELDGGRFPIKRTIGESVVVTADVFADGHDLLAGVLKYRHVPADGSSAEAASPRPMREGPRGTDPAIWIELPLTSIDNDSWTASFTVTELGKYEYTAEAWVDRFGTWLKELVAKADAGQDVTTELLEGAEVVRAAATRSTSATTAQRDEARQLLERADVLCSAQPVAARVAAAGEPQLRALMDARPDRSASTAYDRVLGVTVDPVRARFGAWYEMFPRSCTPDASRSATLREAEARLPEIAAMGFDVLYLPPVHPIGRTHRKGRNNSVTAAPGDPGSPWAIGSEEGGHTAIEPGLGTIDDFVRFVATAGRLGLDIALDIAFQASPDHPWVREHPLWFKHRPDGTIKYAENPPKRYQDIYPLDFDSAEWPALWQALRGVFEFWVAHGVTIFRVDNPHTKSFRFWEWCIAEVKRAHPETIFLAEAFTRPKVMRHLAKAGFTQSYTYYTWRNTASELREYLTELTRTEVQEYMRPNFFANTPDILHEYLQHGGRPAFEVRLVLAATLAASYGIYSGYELCEHVAVRPGSEEYLDSEKYQIKVRDWTQAGNLKELIARVNEIRRAHPALQQNATLTFHPSDNPALLCYSKTHGDDRVFVMANTTPALMQHGWVETPVSGIGGARDATYTIEDQLDGRRYTWRNGWNYIKLDPAERMAHIFVIRDSPF
jgi:starch synthase (maltosyl-transferring)